MEYGKVPLYPGADSVRYIHEMVNPFQLYIFFTYQAIAFY